MAKSPPDFDYLFNIQKNAKNGRDEIKVVKQDPDGETLQIYLIYGQLGPNSNSGMFCDCPASMHPKFKGACKHIGWARRWLKLTQGPVGQSLEEGAYIYYQSKQDTFYLNTSMTGDPQKALAGD